MIDTKNLRVLAEAATPGPWEWDDDCVSKPYDDDEHAPWLTTKNFETSVIKGVVRIPSQHDANYIAACSPDVVLALLDALERKDAEIEALQARVKELEDDAKYLQATINEMCDAIPNYSWSGGAAKEIAAAFAERDALAAELAALRAQEPIAYLRFWAAQRVTQDGNVDADEGFEVCRVQDMGADKQPAFPVFAAPVPPVRVPLTDKEVLRAWISVSDPIALGKQLPGENGSAVREFVRAIEAAIKEQK